MLATERKPLSRDQTLAQSEPMLLHNFDGMNEKACARCVSSEESTSFQIGPYIYNPLNGEQSRHPHQSVYIFISPV